MEPSTKKRRLAPKLAENVNNEQAADQQAYDYPPPSSLLQDASQPTLPQPDQSNLEQFARHLQDAASIIYSQSNPGQYESVSVLLIRWEEDLGVENELAALAQVFQERYNYPVNAWAIPSGPNSNAKISSQVAQQIEYARPGHLLIVYYVGYSFVGSDNNLYWACHSRDDSPRLKWEGIRCIIEDALCDILLLLDCCTDPEAPQMGSNGTKQVVAAYGREGMPLDSGSRTFTANLIDALHKLSAEPPFGVERLHEEIVSLRQQPRDHAMTNGSANASAPTEDRMPVAFTLTEGRPILLAPLAPARPAAQMPEAMMAGNGAIEPGLSPTGFMFEEPRALVHIDFPGDPNHEMAPFKHWLSSTPAFADKVNIEGIFNGPPTIMLISMPIAVYNIKKGEGLGKLIGYVRSHNMLREQQRLVDVTTGQPAPELRHLEDGKILLEAAERAASSPGISRHDPQMIPAPNMMYQSPPPQHAAAVPYPALIERPSADKKDHVEDSDEMHEAAIQLKALSHLRPVSRDGQGGHRSSSHPQDGSPTPHIRHGESLDSPGGDDSAMDDTLYSEFASPASATRPKAASRRSLTKAATGPKQDTRCSMCSHAPFKDSSSLRKHVAAAHTRPFPCAFAFAGCTSTFGSKNEWKRHIASQHLCLTFYRCSSCPQSTVEGKGNEFNRKDLFTQHLRRMHAPFAIKKAIAKGDSKLQVEWEGHVKEMQNSCLVTRRFPPQRSACPKPDCSSVFEGTGSWDDWTEHVGRHMEKGEAGRLGVDRLLAKWALEEGIIERKEDGEWRLVGQDGAGSGREAGVVGLGGQTVGGGGGGYREDVEMQTHTPGKGVEERMVDSMLLDDATAAAAAVA